MTLVLAWRSVSDDLVWVASDSRITSRGEGGHRRLTDSGAKLFDLPQRLLNANTLPPRDVLERNNLGFAYAGSTLVALQAYSAVLPLWNNLLAPRTGSLPTIQQSAQHLARFVSSYFEEVTQSQNGLSATTSCIVSGADPTSGQVTVWHILADMHEGQPRCVLNEVDLSGGKLFEMGSRSVKAEIFPTTQGEWQREPLSYLRGLLRADKLDEVGGGVQVGYIHHHGFALLHDMQPVTVGEPPAASRFRGFDFDEIGYVGDCFCGLPGIA